MRSSRKFSSIGKEFCGKNLGTIHTFQGKQSDIVIFLLGGNPNKYGAINWVSGTVNMINVIVSRAKAVLKVVGNSNVWGASGYVADVNMALLSSSPKMYSHDWVEKPKDIAAI